MKHSHLDEFANRSPLSRIDPRTKLIVLIAFLIAAAFATDIIAVLLVGIASLVTAAISRIPLKHLAMYFMVAIPFIVAIILGALLAGNLTSAVLITIRVGGSILMVIVFATTTKVFEQITAMQSFRIPKIMTSMILLFYRLIFLFIDELERMKLSRIARGFQFAKGNIFQRRKLKIIAHTIGMLFIRTNERAIRVIDSLRCRGFDGTAVVRSNLAITSLDALYVISLCIPISLILMIQLEVIL